ncbi:MAG: M3 family oligoendopeptidase [Candidatus Sericytochromatia bacterium]|nr:M3 family oligoendopeptidase [Candidatus Sericytochromatia bacterium]
MQNLQAPQWDIDSEYPALDSPELQAERQRVQALSQQLQALVPGLIGEDVLKTAQEMALLHKEASLLLGNLMSYTHLKRSTDLKNSAARALLEQLKKDAVQLEQGLQPLNQFLMHANDATFEAFLAHPDLADSHFYYRDQRINHQRVLPLEQENLLSSLELDGFQAWGNLYTNLTGSIDYDFEHEDGSRETLGVAGLLSLLSSGSETLRRRAYEGLNTVFATHEESCAAILNAMAGWRLELCQRRSHTVPTHFLSAPLHMNRMQQASLDQMIEAVGSQRALGHRALALQARVFGKERLDPWDTEAPLPELGHQTPPLSFPAAMDIIAEAFNTVDSSMGDFARLMQEQQWIDAAPLGHKTPGAFCSGFAKSRTPRVLLTWHGTQSNLITLAHELGHAFHSWVMRDMPYRETRYPMSLAETASTFAETVVRHHMLSQASSPAEKLAILWHEVAAVPRFGINIPVRYCFEKAFYEARAGRSFSPEDFCSLMADTWREWYGESISAPNERFWASKLHFYITQPSFYNFPYTFGYLFSQAIYAEQARQGEGFFDFYTALLRDTGRMPVEALVQKHFRRDVTEASFWDPCFDIMTQYVDQFEALLSEL